MKNNTHIGHSRRSFLKTGAVVTTALAFGSTAGIVGGQEAGEIELEGETGGWEGVAPADIDGETNPTLSLEAGEEYTVTWTNEDEQPHNFVIEDADGNALVSSDIIDEGSQTVEFTATDEMAEYYCEVHPQSMRGTIQLAGEGDEDPAEDEQEQPEEEPEEEPTEEEDDQPTDDDDDESAMEGAREFRAHLDGDPHGVETEASGEATFHVSEDGTEIDYEVSVEHTCHVTQAHIHLGSEGEDGPVVVWLYPEEGMEPELIEGRFDGTLADGTVTADDLVGDWEGADFVDAVETFENEGAYVNVHTETHPGGEIRGQITPTEE